jgi:hypothetical protein
VTAHARELIGSKLKTINVARPESLFSLRQRHFPQFGRPLSRLLSQARQLGVVTVAVEQLPEEGELAQETIEMRSRDDMFQSAKHWRVCFFAEHHAFLGYAILRLNEWMEEAVGCVYESVMTRLDRGHNYVRNDPCWRVLCGEDFHEVSGYLFAEQNNLTNVCAHAALRTVCCKGSNSENLSYADINSLLDITHHEPKQVGKCIIEGCLSIAGVSLADMKRVIESRGMGCRTLYYGQEGLLEGSEGPIPEPPYPFQRALYAGMESGYPALLIFGRAELLKQENPSKDRTMVELGHPSMAHVLPVFGHTFNQDTWVPLAETTWFAPTEGSMAHYLPSDLWLSAFIGHDDSLGSNLCVPKHYLQPLIIMNVGGVHRQTTNGAIAVLQTFPEKADRDPIMAESIALRDINLTLELHGWIAAGPKVQPKALPWIQRIKFAIKDSHHDSLILRPLLVKANDYAQHLKELRGWDTGELISPEALVLLSDVPQDAYFWMIEFSVLELFPANLRKLGEVLVAASSTIDDLNATAFMRLPGLLLKRVQPHFGEDAWQAIPSGINSHTSVFGCEQEDGASGSCQ